MKNPVYNCTMSRNNDARNVTNKIVPRLDVGLEPRRNGEIIPATSSPITAAGTDIFRIVLTMPPAEFSSLIARLADMNRVAAEGRESEAAPVNTA
jgi:hypothetical protein